MRILLFLSMLLQVYSYANWEQFSSNDEEPSVYNNVSVITGNLNITLHDGISTGGLSIPITRSYTSGGMRDTERTHFDRDRFCKNWEVHSGWSFFSHANLQSSPSYIYVPEPNGNLIAYEFSHMEGDFTFYKPHLEDSHAWGSMSARTNIRRNLLRQNAKTNECMLFLPDGGMREYSASKSGTHLRLQVETTPSGHKFRYEYDHKRRLIRISARNPTESKTFSFVYFDLEKPKHPFRFNISTSDQQLLTYQAAVVEGSDYLGTMNSNARSPIEPTYEFCKHKGRVRITELKVGGKTSFRVSYHVRLPDQMKEFQRHKVRMMEAPIGPNGEMKPIGQFTYKEGVTEVRDVDGLLIRYFHSSGHLDLIEYYNDRDLLSSKIKFLWEDFHLKAKIMLDAQDRAYFSKTFRYDASGNVIEENFWGNLTGNAAAPFSYDAEGKLNGADYYRKHFSYDPNSHLLLTEEEEGGLTYRYSYLPGTDLVVSKLTCDGNKILVREFKEYDADRLLIGVIQDDGCGTQLDDLTGITYRSHKKYTLDQDTGLVKSITDLVLDVETRQEKAISRVDYTYSPQRRVIAEAVYDASGQHRYTLETNYDAHGRVISKTDPIGRITHYRYDAEGRLIESKEPDKTGQRFSYNSAGNVISETAIDADGREKTTLNQYDLKGHLIAQTDFRGNRTINRYDYLGHCVQSESFPIEDEEGILYFPTTLFTYDIQGNIASCTKSDGSTTHTSYNALRKPVHAIESDGRETHYVYNHNQTLKKIIHPDGSEEHFFYDPYSHITRKEIYSPDRTLLSSEGWVYSAFALLSHIDAIGLATHFYYDSAGRLIKEEAEGRIKTYSYDPLGFLERVSEKGLTHVQLHDVAGRITEQWDEQEGYGKENEMQFFYGANGKKEKAIRITSQGEAADRFCYDGEGRLIAHTDPLGNQTQLIYEDQVSYRQQTCARKITIDPIANQTIETWDAAHRLIQIEKKDPDGHTVSDEQLFYNRSNLKAKRLSVVYLDNTPTKTIPCLWEYDPSGHVIKEIEANQKVTEYAYDAMGRLIKKILPNKTSLNYSYDPSGRLSEYFSSDKTIHYRYTYDIGSSPILIEDLIQGSKHERTYNHFGQLTHETNPCGVSLKWDYDEHGRCSTLKLPDGSSIRYVYQSAHLAQIERCSADGALAYAHSYTQFDPNGHVAEEQLIHHLGTLTSTHDLLERFSSQTSKWLTHSIEYGPSGLVTAAYNSLNGDRDFAYDPLNQLKKEGDTDYHFDSLGNPSDAAVNDLNQITQIADAALDYDPNGNPTHRTTDKENVHYTYDALGRLTTITSPTREIRYYYDSFSRLLSKDVKKLQNDRWYSEKVFYLYDQNYEIGTLSPQGKITQLKVLGLGLKGDIGAAVALELRGSAYAPLHDSVGNIIALIAPNGSILEHYRIDAFGRETTRAMPINPWRFASKRCEDGLFFFGLRFYDPSIGRWLTPDPSGFTDGPNLYAYVANNPLNRLDLFGLSGAIISSPSVNMFWENIRKELESNRFRDEPTPTASYQDLMNSNGSAVFSCKLADVFVVSGNLEELHYTEYEKINDKVPLRDHLPELFEMHTSLETYVNGIGTPGKECDNALKSICQKGGPGILGIAVHNPSYGILVDIFRACWLSKENDRVRATRELFENIGVALSTLKEQKNIDLHWKHTAHSEGGALSVYAIEGMSESNQKLIKNHMNYVGIAPRLPMPKSYVKYARDYFSRDDGVTSFFLDRSLLHDPNYDITFLEPFFSKKDEAFSDGSYVPDHGIMEPTYQEVLKNEGDKFNEKYGLYNAK